MQVSTRPGNPLEIKRTDGTTGDFFSGVDVADIFTLYEFDFTSTAIIVANDGGSGIDISFDSGISIHGQLQAGEAVTFDQRQRNDIALKNTIAGFEDGQSARIFVW